MRCGAKLGLEIAIDEKGGQAKRIGVSSAQEQLSEKKLVLDNLKEIVIGEKRLFWSENYS